MNTRGPMHGSSSSLEGSRLIKQCKPDIIGARRPWSLGFVPPGPMDRGIGRTLKLPGNIPSSFLQPQLLC